MDHLRPKPDSAADYYAESKRFEAAHERVRRGIEAMMGVSRRMQVKPLDILDLTNSANNLFIMIKTSDLAERMATNFERKFAKELVWLTDYTPATGYHADDPMTAEHKNSIQQWIDEMWEKVRWGQTKDI